MTWQAMTGGIAALAIKPDGKIVWTQAAQELLDNPFRVCLFHDAAGNRLGLRRVAADGLSPLRVYYQQDNNRFAIDSAVHLANAGISVVDDWIQTPQPPTPPTPPDDPGDMGIWWIPLP